MWAGESGCWRMVCQEADRSDLYSLEDIAIAAPFFFKDVRFCCGLYTPVVMASTFIGRRLMLSLRKICARCVLTVASEIQSFSLIARLDKPLVNTRLKISCSRVVSISLLVEGKISPEMQSSNHGVKIGSSRNILSVRHSDIRSNSAEAFSRK